MFSYIKSVFSFLLPNYFYNIAGRYYRSLFYFGNKFKCTICERSFRKFLPYGSPISRSNASCPGCFSLERHRLIWLYLKNKTNLFSDELLVLHFSPEKCISDKLRKLANIKYITAEIDHQLPDIDILMNITSIPSDDNSYDVILCNNVLHHVLDDMKAMRELYRVLKPDGWAIIHEGFDRDRKKTFEDPSVTSWEERERLFNDKDHYRIYGWDFLERLKNAGFIVKEDYFLKQFDQRAIEKYRIFQQPIYLLLKGS